MGVKLGYLPIGGAVLFSWASGAIIGLIGRIFPSTSKWAKAHTQELKKRPTGRQLPRRSFHSRLEVPAEQHQEEEIYNEAFEENLRWNEVIFKPADLHDSQIAAAGRVNIFFLIPGDFAFRREPLGSSRARLPVANPYNASRADLNKRDP